MTTGVVAAKWTIDDYHRMIDAGILEGRHVELLNGEIVEMLPEGEPHAHLSSDAADYIPELLRGKAKIREGKPITLPNHSEPEPDIAIVQDLGDVYLDHHPYPENIFWVIEYSNSSLSKDLDVMALRTKLRTKGGVGATPPARGSTPAPRPNFSEYCYKSKTYAKAGIQDYWLINLKRMELIVFRDPIDDEYREKRTLIDGEITPLAFNDVSVEVRRLLRR